MDAGFFILKVVLSGLIIAGISWLAGKNPTLAGFLIALPILSMLAIGFSYLQYQDMGKINQFAISILVSLPLSALFFVPFLLNRWIKWGFVPTLLSGLALLYAGYLMHSRIFRP
jgi:hypothetical protein